MSDYINEGLLSSASPIKKQKDEAAKLVTKWEQSGLLEGMENDWEKSGMAVLLENQARQLIDESSHTGTSANSEEWSGVALPLVRRVFAEIASKEFVSVQPMNLPSGLIFYLDFKYGTDQSLQGNALQDQSLFGGSANAKLGSTDEATGGLYGAGRHGYSINDQLAEAVTLTLGTAEAGTLGTATATLAANLKADGEGVRAFQSTVGIVTGGSRNADGTVDLTLKVADTESATSADIAYHVQTVAENRGDFEDNLGDSADAADTGLQKDIGIPKLTWN